MNYDMLNFHVVQIRTEIVITQWCGTYTGGACLQRADPSASRSTSASRSVRHASSAHAVSAAAWEQLVHDGTCLHLEQTAGIDLISICMQNITVSSSELYKSQGFLYF